MVPYLTHNSKHAADLYLETGEYDPILQTCVVSKKPPLLIGVWACMVAFDIFTLILAVTNSFDRPHRHQVEVLVNLKRDGAAFFLVGAGIQTFSSVLMSFQALLGTQCHCC